MGSIYMENVLGIKNPRVAIVNIGAEEEKGNALVKETFPLLKECTDINFVGSIEAREIPHGEADVIVCEAFVGNVILKLYEGLAGTLVGAIKKGTEQLLAQANVLVEQERRLSALEETAEKTSRAIEMIAAPAASTRDTWQEETGKAIRQMCAEYALNYHSTTGDLYKELEGRAGIDLDARKRNLQKRLRANGATATECKAVSKLSVIARNPQLREIFTGIVQRKAAGLLTNRMTPA